MDKKITKWTLKRWACSRRAPYELSYFIKQFNKAFPVGADLMTIELFFSRDELFAGVIKWIQSQCHSDPKYMDQIDEEPESFYQATIMGPHILMGAEYPFHAGSLLKAKNRALKLFKGGPSGSIVILTTPERETYTRALEKGSTWKKEGTSHDN